jgi:hypothetical protein
VKTDSTVACWGNNGNGQAWPGWRNDLGRPSVLAPQRGG